MLVADPEDIRQIIVWGTPRVLSLALAAQVQRCVDALAVHDRDKLHNGPNDKEHRPAHNVQSRGGGTEAAVLRCPVVCHLGHTMP